MSRKYWTIGSIRPETYRGLVLRDKKSSGRDASKRPVGDRRIHRSRAALTAALTELTWERGFRAIKPDEVAERANVGRSTFYSHFSGVDDLLAQSLEKHLSALAECAIKPEMDTALVNVIAHFWEKRAAARTALQGDAKIAISRLLALRLEESLLELRRSLKSQSELPASLVATQLAAGQLAILDTWLSGRAPGSLEQIANLLHKTTYAAAMASL